MISGCIKYKKDIVIINDGSTDGTAGAVKAIPDPGGSKIILLEHGINRGKGQALITGFEYIAKNKIGKKADG